ncbi:MAG: DUF47 family protein [Betaproteobacteria bacterium]|nr:DUF47 family protein [Betaproteobacteria bacterium]
MSEFLHAMFADLEGSWMFSMMPQRREFYDLLASHSDRVMAASNAVLRLVNALGTDFGETSELIKEVDLNELSGDKIKADLIALLHKSFITPISRDDIHTLTVELDKILDAFTGCRHGRGHVSHQDATPEARELASLGADACQRLNRAVIALSQGPQEGRPGLLPGSRQHRDEGRQGIQEGDHPAIRQ